MEYQNINTFVKTPREISKQDVKLFFKNIGNIGKYLITTLLVSVGLAIITLILYFFSINSIWLPIFFVGLSGISYFLLAKSDPKIDDLNNYPLTMGYVLLANNSLYTSSSQTQAGSLIIFTKEDKLKLNSEFITNIGQKILNNEIENIEFIHKKLNDFQNGKSVFSIDIPKLIEGVKIYCSYVILDSRNLPDGKIPKSRLIPCLIDENNRGIAVPYKLIK